jgi:hypothetical protein
MAARVEVPADADGARRLIDERGWGDGLPIVPPTEAKVAAMLGRRDPAASLGPLAPGNGEATLEVLAANAVMAGCEPAAFPVIVAAVQALMEPKFNLSAVQATTHPVAPLLVVHGPIVDQLGLNTGAGLFGPGFAANATLGRAIRLILMNVGLARPGAGDRSTHGGPAKFSYVMAENLIESPWPAYHTTQGFDAEENAVTVIGAEAPHNVQDHQSSAALRFINIVADAVKQLGHNSWYISNGNDYAVVFGPEHAALFKADGWSREDVQMYLFLRSCRPAADIEAGGNWVGHAWPKWMDGLGQQGTPIPVVRHPSEFRVFVAGGPGKHTVVMTGAGVGRAVTRRID